MNTSRDRVTNLPIELAVSKMQFINKNCTDCNNMHKYA